jgi:eukaryotic-like serine/threonine-protein kinase
MTSPATRSAAWTCSTCGSIYPPDFAVCPRDATPRADVVPVGDPLVGVVLGGTYRIARVLGEGGMARLYEAEHLRVERRFAVKVIHDDLARYPELIARFEREARAAGRIRSRHVVEVIDVLRTADGRPCLVTELLEGEDLQHRLDRQGHKLGPADAVAIARQICRALSDAHACGVVHRDLKPSNVFLCRGDGDGDLLVKVLDFGVAKMKDDRQLTETGALVGTPAYMAPEQARRASDAGPLADIYTVGAVLFRMLTGEPPYGKEPHANPLVLLLNEEPARPRSIDPTIPEAVEAVIQRAMARDPESRPATAADLEAELAALAPGHAAGIGGAAPVASATSRAGVGNGPGGVPVGAAAAGTTAPPSLPRTGPLRPDESMLTTATRMARRARRSRPVALLVVAASSLGVGLWTAALLSALVAPANAVPSAGERTLIALVAAVAALGVAGFQARVLTRRWRSAPAVIEHHTVATRGVFAGLVTVGALELVARAAAALGSGTVPRFTLRLILAAMVVAVVLVWPSLRRRPRVRALLRRWG